MGMGARRGPAVVGVIVALAVADEVDGDGVLVGEEGGAHGVGDDAHGVADGLAEEGQRLREELAGGGE